MGRWQTLMARDGHEFSAYLAAPSGAPRGAVVVLQEIFGVNAAHPWRGRAIRRGRVPEHRAGAVRSRRPQYRARLRTQGHGAGRRLPAADRRRQGTARHRRGRQRRAPRGTRRAGRLLLGRAAHLDRRGRTARAGGGRLLHQPHLGEARSPADLSGHASLWRAGQEHPARAHRAGARRVPAGQLLFLSGRSWLQLRRPRQLRRAQRRSSPGSAPRNF